MKLSDLKTMDQIIEQRRLAEPQFAAQWDRTAFARKVAVVLIRYRAERGITQQTLADETGLKQSAIGRLEIGETPPSLPTLARLTRATGLEFNLDIANGDVAMPEITTPGIPMPVFRFEWSLLVKRRSGGQLTNEQLHQQGEQLMDELLKLELCNPEIADPDTSTDKAECMVTVEMDVAATDPLEAARLALQICRSAIHATGGGTPDWPSDAIQGSDFQPVNLKVDYATAATSGLL